MICASCHEVKIFLNHVEKFIQKASLIGPSQKAVVAVSAGSDSMALLFAMKEILKKGTLRAFHVNHGTRPGNKLEQELVAKACQDWGIPLTVFSLDMNPKDSNFEFKARSKRYELFKANLLQDELLLTAHHLDDSFEWSLLRQLKSGNQNTYLGIPVKNGKIRRPFLCLTKKQIKKFVLKNEIPFIDDPSNKDLRFERNFLRGKVIPNLTSRFPKYLKHYVHRSNELAQKLNVSIFKKNDFEVKKDQFNGILITPHHGKEFNGAQEIIRKAIYSVSHKERGVLSDQIEKLIFAANAGKKGPMIFSGGVLCFIGPGQLYFISKRDYSFYQKIDDEIYRRLENKDILFAPKKLQELKTTQFFNLVIAKDMPKNFSSIKKPHPMVPKSTEFAIKSGLWCNTLSRLLFQYERCSEKEKESIYDLFVS